MALGGVVSETVKALLLPRRLIPIVLVCLPMLAAQGSLSEDPRAIPLGLATCVAFVGIAPVAWRALFPEDRDVPLGALRLLGYAAIGAAVVALLGIVIPRGIGMGPTFLSSSAAIGVTAALFLVGGWGLGRDVGLEASLARERARAEAFAREAQHAQLLALRAHLDPHFLFNTLNAIAEWCRENAETAERAVLQLSSILRAVLGGVRLPSWPLAAELELCRALFSLYQMRAPAAFTVD
jgi:two-component system, LytTR family, sensor histidine kinase AlgZ